MADKDIVLKIAQKLREIRLSKNLTIDRLAKKAHVTKGLLSKVENAKTTPSLPVFIQILESLDISFIDFFEQMTATSDQFYYLTKKQQYRRMPTHKAPGVNYWQVFSRSLPTLKTDISLLTLEPGSRSPMRIANEFKFKHLVSGTVEYHVNNEIIPLSPGDSLCILSSANHYALNRSKVNASLLIVTFHH